MIENGFVHLPKEVAWLNEYLHEVTVFPKASTTTRSPRALRPGGDRTDARSAQASRRRPQLQCRDLAFVQGTVRGPPIGRRVAAGKAAAAVEVAAHPPPAVMARCGHSCPVRSPKFCGKGQNQCGDGMLDLGLAGNGHDTLHLHIHIGYFGNYGLDCAE
jgi:hypothetical protein